VQNFFLQRKGNLFNRFLQNYSINTTSTLLHCVCTCVYVDVWKYVCVYVSLSECCECIFLCMCMYPCLCVYVHVLACKYICVCVSMYECMYPLCVCVMFVCISLCVCVYPCMYVSKCVCACVVNACLKTKFYVSSTRNHLSATAFSGLLLVDW
jgi:hypothetical protein